MKKITTLGLLFLIMIGFQFCDSVKKETSLVDKQCTNRYLSNVEKGFFKHGDTLNLDCIIAENIIEYLNDKLKDPESYEPISFHNFMTLRSEREQALVDKLESIENSDSDSKTLLEQLDDIEANPEADSILNEITNIKPIGYRIIHSFRAKNSYGALDINEYVFYMDTLLTVKEMKTN